MIRAEDGGRPRSTMTTELEAHKISTPDRERLIRAAIEGTSSLALFDLVL
jgi:hypothetical protein